MPRAAAHLGGRRRAPDNRRLGGVKRAGPARPRGGSAVDEEIAPSSVHRVDPRQPSPPLISIDTWRSEGGQAGLRGSADLITTPLGRHEPGASLRFAAEFGAGLVWLAYRPVRRKDATRFESTTGHLSERGGCRRRRVAEVTGRQADQRIGRRIRPVTRVLIDPTPISARTLITVLSFVAAT